MSCVSRVDVCLCAYRGSMFVCGLGLSRTTCPPGHMARCSTRATEPQLLELLNSVCARALCGSGVHAASLIAPRRVTLCRMGHPTAPVTAAARVPLPIFSVKELTRPLQRNKHPCAFNGRPHLSLDVMLTHRCALASKPLTSQPPFPWHSPRRRQ